MKSFSQGALLLMLFLTSLTNAFSQKELSGSKGDSLVEKKNVYIRPWPVSPYSLRAGGFVAINNTDIGAGTNQNPTSLIDLENTLGMNRNAYSFMFNFSARFRKHNRLDFSYFYINRSTELSLNKEITFKDHVYPVDADIKVFFNTNILRLSYGYSFITNEHLDVGALAGFHVMGFNTGLDFVGNTQQFSYNDDVKFTAPLPDFGLWGTYAFHRRWAMSAEVSYFGVRIGEIKGRILNANMMVQYKINNHWEADLGYNYYGVDVKLLRPHLNADFNWSYNGPYVTFAFRFDRFSPKIN